MKLSQGTFLQSGKYRIIRVLGQGGFGITYLAENTLLEKNVAIKEFFPKDFCGRDNTSHITPGTQNNADTIEKLKSRFLKEAKNIAKLDHPGIVKIYDIFEEKNTAYYVMDYIEGENLNDMVKRNGPLPEQKAVEYIIKVGEALEYIHSKQMTHFDVKPANIVVRSNEDQPILIDFGLSKQYDNHGDATSTLMQAVSHGYSPIELYNSGSITTFSPQTDVYSLAATLYFLLTGMVPPNASQLIDEQLWFPSSFPEKLKGSIVKTMTASRRNRTENVASFINELNDSSQIDNQGLNRNEEPSLIESSNNQGDETIILADNKKINKDLETKIVYFRSSQKEVYAGELFKIEWDVVNAESIYLLLGHKNDTKKLENNKGCISIIRNYPQTYRFSLIVKSANGETISKDIHINVKLSKVNPQKVTQKKLEPTKVEPQSKRFNLWIWFFIYSLPYLLVCILPHGVLIKWTKEILWWFIIIGPIFSWILTLIIVYFRNKYWKKK